MNGKLKFLYFAGVLYFILAAVSCPIKGGEKVIPSDNSDEELDFSDAVFVSTTGTDSPSSGLSSADPCRTIDYGVNRAFAESRSWVYIQSGEYQETVTLKEGISLRGGFNSGWDLGPYLDDAHRVEIHGGFYAAENQYVSLIVHQIDLKVFIADLVIFGPDASGTDGGTGRSTYAVHVSESPQLVLDNIRITGGTASNGTDGADGSSAIQDSASDGSPGGDAEELTGGVCNDSFQPGGAGGGTGGRKGGDGGNGGKADTNCGAWPWENDLDATEGEDGKSNADGLAGGPGGSEDQDGDDGQTPESDHGSGGSGASADGTVISGYWVPSDSHGSVGMLGEDGYGGSGGGGSGGSDVGYDCLGSSGGGGGSGGLRAPEAGTGGGTGGSSFAVLCVDSVLTVKNVQIDLGTGGSGGDGGSGGKGQPGGSGASGGDAYGLTGGSGGDGADGGDSGGGGGGAGGNVYGIYLNSSTSNIESVEYINGTAGDGGDGGTVSGNTADGSQGSSGTVSNYLSL